MRIFALFIAFLLVLTVVSADEYYDAGIIPGDPTYGLDRAMERLSLNLAKGNAAKAEKRLQNAIERLAELNAVINNGRTQHVDQLLLDSKNDLEIAEDLVLIEEDAGKDVIALEKKIAVASFNQYLLLEEIMKKVPVAGQSGLRIALEQRVKSNQRALSRVERITGRAAGMDEDLALKKVRKKS